MFPAHFFTRILTSLVKNLTRIARPCKNVWHVIALDRLYIVVVAVKELKTNCNVNEKEVIKIVVEYKRRVSILVAINKRQIKL
jgi:hypothetical protein